MYIHEVLKEAMSKDLEAIYCGDDKIFIQDGQLYNKFRGVLYDFVPETNKLSSDEWSTDKAGSNISNKTNLESRVEKLEKSLTNYQNKDLKSLKKGTDYYKKSIDSRNVQCL